MKVDTQATLAPAFRLAMRQLASGVLVVTHGSGPLRTGFTATSVTSLSMEPPTLLVCVNRAASLYQQLAAGDLFGVNILAAHHTEIADRFAGRDGVERAERFRDGGWSTPVEGVSLLDDALASFVCQAEEVIERRTHAILIGRVRFARSQTEGGALLYWRGDYDRIGWSEEELSRAVGLRQGAPAAFGA